MSLFSKIFSSKNISMAASILPGVAAIIPTKGAISSAIGTLGSMAGSLSGMPSIASPPTLMANMLPAIRTALPGIAGQAGRIVRSPAAQRVGRWSRRAAEAAGYIVVGSQILDAAGNPVGRVPSRRINPLNARALRRSMSRVRAARGICQRVDELTSCKPRRKSCR